MKINSLLVGLLLSFFGFLSCQFQPNIPIQVRQSNTDATRKHLAVLKARKNHTLSIEALEGVVYNFLNAPQLGRSAVSGEKTLITGVDRISAIKERPFSSEQKSRSVTENNPVNDSVEVYAFITEKPGNTKPGYVLACNDIRRRRLPGQSGNALVYGYCE